MPAGYNFGKNDTIDLAITLDAGATASIISQNDPKLPSSSTSFTGIKTNGHQFTIQVQAEDKSVAPVNYRVNLVAASSSQAEISNKSGLRFQIGGDDGESMAATFDRDSQTDMTIKVPYNMVAVTPGGTTTTSEIVASNLEEMVIEKVTLNGSECISQIKNYDSLDKTKIAEAIKTYNSNPNNTSIANESELGIKFSGTKTSKAVELVAGDTVIATGTTSAEDNTEGDIEVEFDELGSITISLGNYNSVNNVDINKTNLPWGRLFENNDGWEDFTQNDLTTKVASYPGPGYCIALAGMKYTETTVTTPAGTTPVPTQALRDKAVYALVSPGASAYIGTDKIGTAIKNSITTFGNIWDTAVNGIFHIYVCQNGVSRTYNIKLEQEDPRTGAKITAPATIGSSNVIGEMEEYTGTPVEKSDNNSLLKVGVGFNWNNTSYPTTYIYNGLEISDGAKAYVLNGDTGTLSGLVDVTPDRKSVV